MRGEELKVDRIGAGDGGSSQSTPQKSGGYLARFLPKLPGFGSSPKPGAKGKTQASPPKRVDNLIRVLETHQSHKFQMKDSELKATSISGPSPEQIAMVTDASRVLRKN